MTEKNEQGLNLLIQDGIVEIKIRKTGETVEVKQEELVNTVGILLKQLNEEKNK